MITEMDQSLTEGIPLPEVAEPQKAAKSLFTWWPGMPEIYRCSLRFIMRHTYAPQYIDFSKLPAEGPGLIIANHISYLDGPIIQCGTTRPIRFVIDKYIYEQPGVNYFMRLSGAIPIAPKKGIVEQALDEISQGLKNGDLICIFPEGQLTYTGNLGRFKPGIEWIISRDPVPVYPLALKGLWGSIFSRKYLRAKWRMIPRHFSRNIKAICGDPIMPEDVQINYLQRVIMELKNSI